MDTHQPHPDCHSYWWTISDGILVKTPYYPMARRDMKAIDRRARWDSTRKAWLIPSQLTAKMQAVEKLLGDPKRGMVIARVPADSVCASATANAGGVLRIMGTSYVLAGTYDPQAEIKRYASPGGTLKRLETSSALLDRVAAGDWEVVMPRTLAEANDFEVLHGVHSDADVPEPPRPKPKRRAKSRANPVTTRVPIPEPVATPEARTPIEQILRVMSEHNVRLIDIARALPATNNKEQAT